MKDSGITGREDIQDQAGTKARQISRLSTFSCKRSIRSPPPAMVNSNVSRMGT